LGATFTGGIIADKYMVNNARAHITIATDL
jgi:hypothetical protein